MDHSDELQSKLELMDQLQKSEENVQDMLKQLEDMAVKVEDMKIVLEIETN